MKTLLASCMAKVVEREYTTTIVLSVDDKSKSSDAIAKVLELASKQMTKDAPFDKIKPTQVAILKLEVMPEWILL